MSAHHHTALISGAGSGIGRAVAQALAALDIRVALLGRRRDALEQTRQQLGSGSTSAVVEPCDVANRTQVQGAVERVLAAFGGRLDILVCNAGTNTAKRTLETLDPAEWDRLIATNLTGAFNLVHSVLPAMRKHKRGLVVQIASISGIRASVLGGSAYSASKFGQSALGLCLGREERGNGIRSAVIYPGEVNTPILDERPVPVPAERRAVILQPDDVAAAVRFLAELNPRVSIPELVIVPAVDDFF